MKTKIVFILILLFIICSCQTKHNSQIHVQYFNKETVRRLGGENGFRVYDKNPVLTSGNSGEWDAGALGSMSLLRVGEVYHMYYEAWGTRSEKEWDADEYNSLQIGHAISLDGIHWTKDPDNPVLPRGASGEWDRNGTWDPFVIFEDGMFKMWYGGGNEECDWGFAVSKDGSHFEKKGRISQLGGVEDNHVVHDTDNNMYYMYYWDREYEPTALFRAKSVNETGFDYTNPDPIRLNGEIYPFKYKFTHVIKEDRLWHMFYADFVRPHCAESVTRYATSTDGLHWFSRNKNILKGMDAELLKADDGLYLMYFGPQGYFDRKGCDIRVAVYNGRLNKLVQK